MEIVMRKNKKERLRHRGFVTAVFFGIFLALSLFMGCSADDDSALEWKDGGIYGLLPAPISDYGSITKDADGILEFSMYGVTHDNFTEYVKRCVDMGFSQASETLGQEYSGVNAQGGKLTVKYSVTKRKISAYLDLSEARAELPMASNALGGLPYTDVADMMSAFGFVNVQLKEESVPHNSGYADYLVKSVTIDGKEFAAGDKLSCAKPVVVTYYKRSVTLDYSASSLSGKEYSYVERLMKNEGFKNVIVREVYAAADLTVPDSMNGKTVSVSINGDSGFDKDDAFPPSAFVTVTYYNLDVRMDVSHTELLGQTKDNVYQKLSGMGFKNVRLVPTLEGGDKVSYLHNGTVSKITIGNSDSFSVNDSFDRNEEVTVTYYKLDIAVGKSSKEIKDGMLYTEAEEYLRGLGFVNIKIEASKEIITGIINRPYEIKSITVNGDSKFDAEDVFHHDHEIVIVYYDYR